ncbi:MAG: hypothetical protein ABIK89_03490, partial [Planctomycetota bacterium]
MKDEWISQNATLPPHPSPFPPSSFILLTLLLPALGGACRPSPLTPHPSPLVTFSGPTMGTWFTVKVVELPDSVDAET